MPDLHELRDQLQRTLGNAYSIERELGGGGMSRVFLAEESRLNRKVVVKVLAPELAAELSVDRFEREIQMAAQLQHPQIVPVFSAGAAAGVPFYTMPFIEGESLRVRLSRGQLAYREVIDILRDVAKALAFAHSRGVVHRDVKPDNVLLTSGSAVVTDFGIAKAVAASQRGGAQSATLTQAGVAIGTPAYMAPEQAAADPDTDHRADLYAFGCVAYEMIAGEPPFTGRNAAALLAAHLTQPAMPVTTHRTDVPQALVSMVSRCLEKDPGARPANAAALLEHLDAATAELSGPRVAVAAPRNGAEPASIAVLPFANLSGVDDEYLSDGISEEIINALAHLPGLRVAARSSCFAFKGQPIGVAEFGARLKASRVLEGSVRRAGTRLRITAQFIDVASGSILWSERFDRESHDVFAIQDEIARRVADQLQVTLGLGLGVRVRALTDSVEAYDLYLRGRYFWTRRGKGVAQALQYFKQAIAIDPRCAAAHAGLADCYVLLAVYGYISAREAREPARLAAYRALELDDRLAEAHTSVGLYECMVGWHFDVAERELRRASELDPSKTLPLLWLGMVWAHADRIADVRANVKRALEIEPLSLDTQYLSALNLACCGALDEAWRLAQRILETDASFPMAHVVAGWILGHQGRFAEAIASMLRAADLTERNFIVLAHLGRTYGMAGRRSEAASVLRELESRGAGAMFRAPIHWHMGDDVRAFDLFEEAAGEHCFFYLFAQQPGGETLKRDPRWRALLQRVGLSALLPQPLRDEESAAGPVVAVLPFRNAGGGAETDYFVDGLTDDLITALTRFRDVTVIGRNTSFHHRHRVDDATAVGSEIGARYVIDGSIRRLGDAVRVSARLTDVTNGRLLWSETYDRRLTAADLFALQDEIIAQIVGAIAGSYGVIARSGLERSARATENLEAYDCLLRAYAYEQLLTPESHAETRDHLERAVRLDPVYADAWSKLAFVYADEHAFGYNPRPNALDRALAAARKGVELDPASQMTHWHLARALFWRNEVDAAMVETDRALIINPNNAFVLAAAGVYMAFTSPDRLERGAALTEQALRIDPNAPGWYHVARILQRYARREYAAALAAALRMDMPGFYQTHMWRLAIYGQLGRSADAATSKEKLLELHPTFANVARHELAKLNVYPELAGHIVEGWRMAGFDPA